MKCNKILLPKLSWHNPYKIELKQKQTAPKQLHNQSLSRLSTFHTPLQSHVSFCTLYLEKDVLLPRYLNSIHVKIYPEDISVFNHRNDVNFACKAVE